jgi:hypothetical protein
MEFSSMRLNVLLIAVLTLCLIPFGTQVYGSAESNNRCDLLVNQSCLQTSSNSQVKSDTESETSQTPLILPDLSPTRDDLNNAEADEGMKTSQQSTDNGNAPTSTSTSTDSDDNEPVENNGDSSDVDSENNDGDSENNDGDSENNDGDSENNDGDSENNDGDSGGGPSMIPFP